FEPAKALPGGQQRVLHGVLGVLEGSEHPVAMHLQLAAVLIGQLAERVAVSGLSPRDPLGLEHAHPRSPPSPARRTLILHRHRRGGELGGWRAPSSQIAVCARPRAGRHAALGLSVPADTLTFVAQTPGPALTLTPDEARLLTLQAQGMTGA